MNSQWSLYSASCAAVDDFAFWEVAVFDAVINEGLAETSISHDEFQINKRVWLKLMLMHSLYLVQILNIAHTAMTNAIAMRRWGRVITGFGSRISMLRKSYHYNLQNRKGSVASECGRTPGS